MLKRFLCAALAVISTLLIAQVPAFATSTPVPNFRYYGVLRSNIDDRNLTLYANPKDAVQHDGWCYVPGNKKNRGNAWSCTVTEPRPNETFVFPNVAEGTQALFGNRVHIAHRTMPQPGYAPYCHWKYRTSQDGGQIWKDYLCAYWV